MLFMIDEVSVTKIMSDFLHSYSAVFILLPLTHYRHRKYVIALSRKSIITYSVITSQVNFLAQHVDTTILDTKIQCDCRDWSSLIMVGTELCSPY
jgi:hypothetical protein